MYRYISRESCSQFDSLPLTYLTISGSWLGRELVGVVEGSFPASKVEEIPSDPADGELDIDDDDKASLVAHLFEQCLSLERVGWIIAHPPRKESMSHSDSCVSHLRRRISLSQSLGLSQSLSVSRSLSVSLSLSLRLSLSLSLSLTLNASV